MAPKTQTNGKTNGRASAIRELRAAHPSFLEAVTADARITAAYRNERSEYRSRLDALLQAIRLMFVTDAFVALVAYRAQARMRSDGHPDPPRIAHRLAIMTAQISIADAAVIQPGVFIPNGQVVIQGMAAVDAGVVIGPWVTIGLLPPEVTGPRIGPGASIGPAAQVLGVPSA